MTSPFEHRLLIVHNPTSSAARFVQTEVFGRLSDANIGYDTLMTQSGDSEQTIDEIATVLRSGDYILSAGGDSTAMQLANAALRSNQDVTLGFLPFGNFNDTAKAHCRPSDTVIDILNAQPTPLSPLEVFRDGTYWRSAVSQVTLGWTATGAAEFNERHSRKQLQNTPQALKLGYSLLQLT